MGSRVFRFTKTEEKNRNRTNKRIDWLVGCLKVIQLRDLGSMRQTSGWDEGLKHGTPQSWPSTLKLPQTVFQRISDCNCDCCGSVCIIRWTEWRLAIDLKPYLSSSWLNSSDRNWFDPPWSSHIAWGFFFPSSCSTNMNVFPKISIVFCWFIYFLRYCLLLTGSNTNNGVYLRMWVS